MKRKTAEATQKKAFIFSLQAKIGGWNLWENFVDFEISILQLEVSRVLDKGFSGFLSKVFYFEKDRVKFHTVSCFTENYISKYWEVSTKYTSTQMSLKVLTV